MAGCRISDVAKKRSVAVGGILLGATAFAATLFTYSRFRQDVRAAYERLGQIERRTVTTRYGEMAVAQRGEGLPLLVIHGAAGGVDQGLQLGAQHVARGFRVIAPARFGYPGTSLPDGATPRQQAEVFVALLDRLGIEKTAVIAYSAGGPSAAQLALHHSERISALVLVSTAMADKELDLPPRPVLERLMHSDFAFWLLTHPLRSLTQRMFVPGSYELSPQEEAEVGETVEMLLPIEPRAEGLLFDMYVTNTDPHERSADYGLEAIAVPTLVVNAVDDPAADYEDARAMTARIPGAQMVTVLEGGHLMLGQEEWLPDAINRFLQTHSG